MSVSSGQEALDALTRAKDDYGTDEPIRVTVMANPDYQAPGGYAQVAAQAEHNRQPPSGLASLFSCVNAKKH